LRLIPQGDAYPVLAPIYDTWRGGSPGAISQTEAWWACKLSPKPTWRGGGRLFVVVCDPTDEHDGGYALYHVRHTEPMWTREVGEPIATPPAVEARLWRYLFDVDLIGTLRAPKRAMDDPLPWRLADPRQVLTTSAREFLQVRIMDVTAALAART